MRASRGDEALRRWLEQRLGDWQRLAALVRNPRDTRTASPQGPLELAERFRTLSRDRTMAHALMPGSRLARELDALFLTTHELLHRPPRRLVRDLLATITDDVPGIVREMRVSIHVVTWLFVASALAGWMLVTVYPEMAGLFASAAMVDRVEAGELWTDDLLNVFPSSVLSLSIMANNIAVSLSAFALGALFGIGTFYIIALNGLMLGGIFAFTHQHGMAERLFAFVVAHGVVEISVICLAGAAGLELGRALVEPGNRSRARAFQRQASRAGRLVLVCAVFLVGAGIIEGYVSPDPAIPLWVRAAVGIGYAVLLWLVLTGRLRRRRGSDAVSPAQ